MPRQFRLSVRLSVTHVLGIKTAERIIEILSPFDRPIILVFRHQELLRMTASHVTGAPNTRRDSDFRPIRGYKLISKTVIDRGTFTVEDEYKLVCALWNGATFDDLG